MVLDNLVFVIEKSFPVLAGVLLLSPLLFPPDPADYHAPQCRFRAGPHSYCTVFRLYFALSMMQYQAELLGPQFTGILSLVLSQYAVPPRIPQQHVYLL